MKKLAIVFGLILLLAACSRSTEDSGGETANPENDTSNDTALEVYTTVYPLAYFTERIGGEHVEVQSVYPAGANEHTFEPSQQDMIALAEADLLFYIGLGLEGFIDSTQQSLSNENVKFIATADAVSDEELETAGSHEGEEETAESHDGHDHGSTDPHVWMSPKLSQDLAESIKNALSEADIENAESYESNYAELIIELEELDLAFADLGERASKDTFFVSHAAFSYVSEPYGIEQVAIAGLNSQDEPSQRELAEIVDRAKENNVEYIVFEQNVSSNLTEVIQNEVGAEAVEMHNLGVLTQEDIDNGETYFSLMEHNLEVLDTVLK